MRGFNPPVKRTVLSSALISMAQSAYAQSELQGDLTFSILKAIVALAFVLALFFLMVYLIRRYYPRMLEKLPNAPQRGERIELRATRALGPKRFLYIVRIGKMNYLIGGSDQSLNKIDQWTDDSDTHRTLSTSGPPSDLES